MRPANVRRFRRRTASREAGIFKKDNAQEHSFFGAPSHESFFQPTATIHRKCDACEKEDKRVHSSTEKKEEEKKVHSSAEKKEEDKKVHSTVEKKEEEKKVHSSAEKKEEDKVHRTVEKKEEDKKVHSSTEKKEEDKKAHSSTEKKEEDKVHRKEEKKEEEKKAHSTAGKQEEDKKVHSSTEKQEEEKISKKDNGAGTASHNSAPSYIKSINGRGQSMSAGLQQFYGGRMGYDFSSVKIHTGKEAADSAKDVNAKAYTYGNHVVFNEGQYNPNSHEGKKLVAHELTHVMQNNKASTGKVQRSPLSDDLRNVWTTQGKGPFFERLRNLTGAADTDTHVFVRSLVGDDRWLAQNILTYGREASWPIHLRVQREMKGWSDSGGKGAVFEILRAANGSQASNTDLETTLHSVFSPGSDDVWLADNLQLYGRETNWPIHLKVIREMKGWADSGGMPAVLQLLRAANGTERNNAQLTAVLNVFGMFAGNTTLLLNLQAYGPEAMWPQASVTPADNFAGRSMVTFGVGETVNLNFTSPSGLSAAALGGLQWSVTPILGSGSAVTGTVNGVDTLTAGDTFEWMTLEMKAVSGPNAGRPVFSRQVFIVPPNGALMQKTSGLRHTTGTWGIGFRGTVFLRPMDVSFTNAQFSEGNGAAIATGYLGGWNGIMHCASNPCNVPMSIGTGNSATGCHVNMTDTVDSTDKPAPFSPGVFIWPISWQYNVGTGPWRHFFTAFHINTADASGAATGAKAGAGPFLKNAADATSTF